MPSRISGACNTCRSKKQKCSGDRLGCQQCLAAGQECTWPAQRKRGPAKGYIEGLEHRLHDAEHLLLQVLPYISNQQLAAAIDEDKDETGSPNRNGRVTPPLLNKKVGIDYWEGFPLDSAENVRRWQQDCAEGRHRASPQEDAARSQRRISGNGDVPAARGYSPTGQGALVSNSLPEQPSFPAYQRSSPSVQNRGWPAMYTSPPAVSSGPSFSTTATRASASQNGTPSWAQSDYSITEQPPSMSVPGSSPIDVQYQAPTSYFFSQESQRQYFW